MEPTPPHPPLFELSVLTRGDIDDSVVAYAREKMLHAARAAPRRILFGRLKLTNEPHRSVERPAIAEVMLDLVGRAVRAHVAAGDLREAALGPRLGERSVLSQRHAERSEGAEG